METLYEKAVKCWKGKLPEQLAKLDAHDDDTVFSGLCAVLNDLFSPTWVDDARIAWALMQGRCV